ncbi:MAG: hypothetical protein KDA37_14495, partial [Planctomycetales bacterium]|nr:hypothetical protein [Planctomycetales bacterium]
MTTRPAGAVTVQDQHNYLTWGGQVYARIEQELRRPNSSIYAEATNQSGSQHGGINGNAFIWAASVQFRSMNALLNVSYTEGRKNALLAMSDELHQRYWLDSSDGQNGYVVAPGSTERYYDDNAHMTVALMEAYEITGEQRLLDRAIATHDFVLEGEDSHQGGGVYFREGSGGNKNTISTLQEARGAAMIYQATGQQRFLDDAVRLLDWTNSHVRTSDYLYYQEYRDQGIDDISNVPLTNSAGMGILTNLEMYDITGDQQYLDEARYTTVFASRRFQDRNSGSVWGGGYWAFELVAGWIDLFEHDGAVRWLDQAASAIDFLKANIEDDNRHYGRDWHATPSDWPDLDEWLLIDQASVARVYLRAGFAEAPAIPGDYNDDGVVDAADYTV